MLRTGKESPQGDHVPRVEDMGVLYLSPLEAPKT